MKCIFLALLFLLPALVTAKQNPTSSFQGYSGLVNTPSATLFDSGELYFQYSNQTERSAKYNDTANFHFGIGLWDFVELSGRNSAYGDSLNESSDLSANLKVGIPFIPQDWFKLAVGIQDLGGAANNFDAKYVVASKTLFETIEVSLGAGTSDSSLNRLNGAFGGISWQPTDWAKISLEYDAQDTNLGLHLFTPQYWFDNGTRLTANILAYSSNEQLTDNVYYGIGLNIPLHSPTNHSYGNKNLHNKTQVPYYQPPANIDGNNSLLGLQQKLEAEGFEAVRVGKTGVNTAYVELENHIYNRNQLDGLGVALGMLSTSLSDEFNRFKLVIKEREIATLVVSGSPSQYRAFLNNEQVLNLSISTDTFGAQQDVQWLNQSVSDHFWLKPRFTFWPSLVSTVGTELGMFDASLALLSHLELPLWQGAAISAVHLTQLAETEDFKDGEYFDKWKQKNGIQEYSLHQTISLPFNVKNMVFAGKYRQDYNYLANEIRWQSDNGVHRINLLTAQYEKQNIAERQPYSNCNVIYPACWPPIELKEREVIVGMYRYYSTALDATAEIRYGQFWQQDQGFIVKIERMFGDVTINLNYQNTKVENEEATQFIGLGFSIPLTPRKDYNSKYVQVRGIPKWNYTVSTLVGESHNNLTPGTGDSARLFYNLDNIYYNLDRLGKAYVYDNAQRLKQAYMLVD